MALTADQPVALPDGRDGAEDSQRGHPHDVAQDLEEDGLDVADGLQHRGAALAQRLHREADQERHEQGGQHRDRRRDDLHHESSVPWAAPPPEESL